MHAQNGGGRHRKDSTPDFNNMTPEELKAHFHSLKDKRKNRKPLSVKQNLDYDKFEKQGLTILARELESLMYLSSGEALPAGLAKLGAGDSIALKDYLKLIKELKKTEENQLDNLSDEQLEKLAHESSTGKEDTGEETGTQE